MTQNLSTEARGFIADHLLTDDEQAIVERLAAERGGSWSGDAAANRAARIMRALLAENERRESSTRSHAEHMEEELAEAGPRVTPQRDHFAAAGRLCFNAGHDTVTRVHRYAASRGMSVHEAVAALVHAALHHAETTTTEEPTDV